MASSRGWNGHSPTHRRPTFVSAMCSLADGDEVRLGPDPGHVLVGYAH